MLSLIVSALPRPPVVCVHCEFVGGFGTESVDVGGQPVEAVVFEGFVTAVGIVGTDGVARCVVGVGGNPASGIVDGNRQKEGVLRPSENRKNRWRALRHALLMNLEIYAGYGLLPER